MPPKWLIFHRRIRDDERDTEKGEPRRKRRRTTASSAPSGSSNIGEEPSVVAGEDKSCARLLETALFVRSRVEMNVPEYLLRGAQGNKVRM